MDGCRPQQEDEDEGHSPKVAISRRPVVSSGQLSGPSRMIDIVEYGVQQTRTDIKIISYISAY